MADVSLRVLLEIGSLKWPQEMLVADIKDDCILGQDFLELHGCVIDLKRECSQLGMNKFHHGSYSRLLLQLAVR